MTSPLADRPYVTFALFAYNQEKYIREAVEGAFSQTYSPLEIILSDDCSSDRTFEIMEQMARKYQGPHTIRLNRQRENSGIGAHVSHIARISQGQLIVLAAGDDISECERTGRILDFWVASNREIAAIESGYTEIDCDGGVLGTVVKNRMFAHPTLDLAVVKNEHFVGATAAYDADLFKEFPPFLQTLVHEDCALLTRTYLLRRSCGFIPEPLVRYRRSVGVSAAYNNPHRGDITFTYRAYTDYLQKLVDSQGFSDTTLEAIAVGALRRRLAEVIVFNSRSKLKAIALTVRHLGFFWSLRAWGKWVWQTKIHKK